MKQLGTYKYKHPTRINGERVYIDYTMRVEVVGERNNKHTVLYLGFHASGEAPQQRPHNVRKDKVRLDIEQPAAPSIVRDIRLPYIDKD
jgi:hypothetical protein